jgi:sugar lactone lactonase YvrE
MNLRTGSFACILSLLPMAASGCGGHAANTGMPPAAGSALPTMREAAGTSVLKSLTRQVVIGSTIDPVFGQLNPYGLDVARSTAGKLTAGDLVVCNFNAKSNVQGTGFTIVALHPVPHSKPALVYASKKILKGCNALALAPSGDFIWAADWSANDNPIVLPTGKLLMNIRGSFLDHPFGQAFAQPSKGDTAFYESNAGNGTIVRFDVVKNTAAVVAKGFPVNNGKPGSILSPSGLQYDAKIDTLYVVDGTNNALYAIAGITKVPENCVTLDADGKHFSGCAASRARIVFMGKPLNGPISSALLYNGNLVLGNTLDPGGKNLMIEITPSGKVLDVRDVDKGAAGALFGIVATGTTAADTKIFFNDDNANNLQVLER